MIAIPTFCAAFLHRRMPWLLLALCGWSTANQALANQPGSAAVVRHQWPQWRGPARDGIVHGFAAPDTWPWGSAWPSTFSTSCGSAEGS